MPLYKKFVVHLHGKRIIVGGVGHCRGGVPTEIIPFEPAGVIAERKTEIYRLYHL